MLGEDIEDFGGLTLAYHTWKAYDKDKQNITGTITLEQQVFFSFDRIWGVV